MFEWAHLIIAAVIGSGAALGGLIGGVWRVSKIEQGIRDDFQTSLAEVENDLRDRMTVIEQRSTAKVDGLSLVYDETLKGLRQKINDVELQTERHFVAKQGFDEFRKEYREDMLNLNEKIDRIPRAAS